MSVTSHIPPDPSFKVGDWYADPASGRLTKDGVVVKLEPKVMQVLVYLAEHSGEVISRQALEEQAWAGIVVGYDAISQSIIKLRKALDDDSRNPQYIETISKKGYRLIAPITPVTPVTLASANESPTTDHRNNIAFHSSWLKSSSMKKLAGMMAVAVLIGCLLYFVPGVHRFFTGNTENPSVVVLPFKNLSNDASQEYFSDGITDDLITDLSRLHSLRVIARQSSYYYKHNPARLEDIAQQLHATYIIEGSVRKSGNRVRINVQLTDANKGENIWAERFDNSTDNIFDIQDEITQQVTQAMAVTLAGQDLSELSNRGTKSFAAYDVFLLGQQYIKTRSKQGYEQSISAYQKAIEIDPNYARAYGAMAVTLSRGYRYQWSTLTAQQAHQQALDLAQKAVALNRTTPEIFWSLGYVHLHRREYDQAEEAARQSVALSPNYADGYALLANIANWRGHAREAINYMQKAITLNPHYTFQYSSTLGMAYYNQGQYQPAINYLRDALERNENALNPRLYLAACYVQQDQPDEAAWEINQITINRPQLTLATLNTILPYEDSQVLDSLRTVLGKAGLPDAESQ